MQFESTHITGKGRGKPMGFPTINLKIPDNFKLKDGVYAVKIVIENHIFKGALHFGPTPTFSQIEKSLEVYLIGLSQSELIEYGLENMDEKIIKVEILEYLRPIIRFRQVGKLVKQIQEDVSAIKNLSNSTKS